MSIIRDREKDFSFHDYYDVIGDSKKYIQDAQYVWDEFKEKNIIISNMNHFFLLNGLAHTMIMLFNDMAKSYESCEGAKKEVIDKIYAMFNGMRQAVMIGSMVHEYYKDKI